ncbi:unnamed protein product [Miscanthus lutarioriparius]|uniref:Protein PLASTID TRANSCRIPTIONALLY ACTIVE 7 n=1 Tax=Miscanthus lutarioriparius TaxID=422564 RepID=A0A811P9I1_9POAL|nr:unnamed protein product [Miscanthus lutarioriparius]
MRQEAATTGSCTTKILSLPITPIAAAAVAPLLRRDGDGNGDRLCAVRLCLPSFRRLGGRRDPFDADIFFFSVSFSSGPWSQLDTSVGRPKGNSRSDHFWPNGPVPSASTQQPTPKPLGNQMRMRRRRAIVTLGAVAEVGTGGPAASGECGVVGNWYLHQPNNAWNFILISLGMTKEDDMLRYKLDRIPFLEEKVRKVRENGKIICLDINQLMLSQENRFAFTMEVAEEANAYLEKNRHEYGLKKPILHVLSDRMNEAGFSRPEGYLYPYPIKPGPYFIKEEGN